MLAAPLILTDPEGRRYVVGLHWKRIVTANARSAEREATRYVRSCGATHAVFTRGSRGEISAVGCAALEDDRAPVLSLANAFCLQQEDAARALVAVPLDDHQAWLCAVADGLVVNGYDLVLPQDAITEHAEAFAKRYPDSPIRHQGALLGETGHPSLLDVFEMARAHQPDCQLQPLRGRWSGRRRGWVAGVAAGVAGVAYLGLTALQHHQARQRAALESLNQAPEISAQQAWQKVLADWERKANLAAPTALTRLLEELETVPLDLADWQATHVRCTRQASRWGCSVRFDRRIDRRSTTQDFLAKLPATWSTDGGSINSINARFEIDAPLLHASAAQLPRTQDVSLAVLAHLQRDNRAFVSADLGPVVAVKLSPTTDGEGRPMTVDPAVAKPQPVMRTVQWSGPLRSLYLLESLPISWNLVHLDISRAQLEHADLTVSGLMVREARGEVYARQ